jgi:hypothetical protein
MLPSGPIGSCNPSADFFWHYDGLHVDAFILELGSCAPVVTRSLGFVSRSRAFLAGGLGEVCVLAVCVCVGVRCTSKGIMCMVFGSGFPHELDHIFSLIQ